MSSPSGSEWFNMALNLVGRGLEFWMICLLYQVLAKVRGISDDR